MAAWSKQFKVLYEDYNPAEPRIEKGNEGGGRWTDSNSDSIFNNQELKAAEEKMSRIMPTNFLPGYGSDEWKDNRVFMIHGEKVVGYDAAIEKFEKIAEAYAEERVKKDRQAFIILGPPGAGKSTWKRKLCKIYGTSCPDVDDIKKALPEYGDGVGASAVHEESADIGAVVARNQFEKGNNVVLEKIGFRKATVNALISTLKERNYDVHLIDVDVPMEVAMERMLKRFHETGRFISLAYMKKVDHGPFKTFNYLKTIRGIDSYVKIDKKNHLEGKGEIYKALSAQAGWRGAIREEVAESFEKETYSLTKFRVHREDVEFEKKHPRVPGGPPPLVEEVEPAVAPLSPLKQFKVRRGPLLEYDPNQPRLPKGTPTVGDKHAGEWTKGTQAFISGWKDGDVIYHNVTGYPLKVFYQDNKLMVQTQHGAVFPIEASMMDTYSKTPPANPTYKLGKLQWEKPHGNDFQIPEPEEPQKASPEEEALNNAAELAKKFPSLKTNWVVGDFVKYVPPMNAPDIPINKNMTYTLTKVNYDKQVVQLDGSWMIPMSFILDSMGKENGVKPTFKAGDIIESPTGGKYKITKIEDGVASGFLLDDSGKPTHKDEAVLASMTYLKSTGYKLVASDPDNVSKIPLPPIKKFKVTHAERPEIPQIYNVGDKVSFRGKMYFVKYVNPKDHMIQIELAKIRHGKVTGVVTGAIVNVKPDTILPWGVKPNNKAIQVGGDEWNKKTAVRLEYDYAKVKPLLNQLAEDLVGSDRELDKLPEKFDPLNETSGADYRRTQALAKIMSVERAAQLLVERGLMNDIYTARTQIKSIDERLWTSWKDSSTTENGMILQVAAADELGGRLHEYDGLKKHESIKDANRKFRDIGGFDGVKAYLRGKWETTQYLLDKAGIQTMKIYRNIAWDVPFMGSKEEKAKVVDRSDSRGDTGSIFTRYPNAVVSRNGCQSCTTDADVANRWGGNIVFRVSAPRTAALSIPAYGINIHTEHECVLAGTAWQAYDVWQKPAPTFEEVPLDTTNMVGKMYTNPDNPNMPKMKTDLSKLLSKKGLYSGKSDAYWKKYGSQGLEDKFKPGNKVKWNYPGNDPDNVYTVVGKNDYGIKLKNSQGTNLQAKPEDLTILSKFDQIDLKKDGLDKKPKFSSGDKISGASGSNFADTEFTVNSVNRNGTMDVTSEYGTPYTGVKPHLFQTSTKVQGKFKVGDTLNYGTVAKYEVVKGPYKTYNNDVGYDIKDSSGKIYKNEVLPSYVTKKEPLPNKYNVGDLVKGNVTGNIYKIEKIDYDMAHLVVQKLGPHDPLGKIGDTSQSHLKWIGGQYTKVEPEEPKEFKVGDTITNPATHSKYEIVGGPYKKESGKIAYDLKGENGEQYNNFVVDPNYHTKVESNQHKTKFYYGKLGNGDILYSSLNKDYKWKVADVKEKGYTLIPINKLSGVELAPIHNTYNLDMDHMFTSEKEAEIAHEKWKSETGGY